MKKLQYRSVAWMILFTFCVNSLTAQQARQFQRNIDLLFDSSGRLISFPPAVVRDHKKICLQLAIPSERILSQLGQFRLMLAATYDTLTQYRNSYYCYFRDVPKFNFLKYIKDLKDIIQCLDSGEFFKTRHEEMLAQLAIYDWIPAKQFVSNFYDQFQVKIYRGNILIKTLKMDGRYDVKKKCFYFTADCQKVGDLSCLTCGVRESDQLQFQLINSDPLALTVMQWFKANNTLLGSFKTETIAKGLDTMAVAEIMDTTRFLTGHAKTKELKGWYPLWFWYTKGLLTLDPFQIPAKDPSIALNNNIKAYNMAIDSIQREKTFIDSSLAKLRYSILEFTLFQGLRSMSLRYSRQLDSINHLKETDQASLGKLPSSYAITQPWSYLNKVNLFLSDFRHVRPQVQFDAKNGYNYTATTKRELHRVTEMPENEQPYILVHNVDSSVTLKFDSVIGKPFSDNEEFTEWIGDLISQADSVKGAINPVSIANLQDFAFSLSSHLAGDVPIAPEDTLCRYKFDNIANVNPVYVQVKELAKAYAHGYLTFFYRKSIFKESAPDKPIYRTETNLVKITDAPIKDSISVKQTQGGKQGPAMSANVKVGKLWFVQMAAGIVATNNNTTVTKIDTAGSGFRVSSTDNKARAVLGFKVYPFQYYKRDRWLLPRYPLHRLSIFGGFEMLHPLDNFYVGGCYDIVPGLGFSVGANYYLQTKYKIENNAVVDTDRSYKSTGPYYAVMVNPVLFVKFVKLFFKAL